MPNQAVTVVAILLFVGFTCAAQDQSPTPDAAPRADTVTIPASTRFALVLTKIRFRAKPCIVETGSMHKPPHP